MDLDICMASDDNYAIHLGISIVSILENNSSSINLHILNNDMSESNLNKLKSLEDQYSNLCINFYNIHDYFIENKIDEFIKNELVGTEAYDLLGISTFSRLFLAEILPENIMKVLYLDADTLVLNNLDELFSIDLKENYIGGVVDGVAANITKYFYKGEIKPIPFVNAGVLLVNLEKWRENNIAETSLFLIKSYPEKNFLNDQNLINIISGNDVLLLDPKYNVMSESFYVSYEKILRLNSYFGVIENFYTKEEIDNSLRNPTVVHFITQLWDRPWIPQIGLFNHECKNPYNKCYHHYKDISLWSGVEIPRVDKSIIERIFFEIRRFIMIYFPAQLLYAVFYIKNKSKFKK